MPPKDELQEEIQAHLDLLAEEHERRGLSREEARLAARRDFGGVEQMKEAYRDQRRFRWIDSRARDVRYGIRLLWKAPAFTAVAVLSLALGIGASVSGSGGGQSRGYPSGGHNMARPSHSACCFTTGNPAGARLGLIHREHRKWSTT